MDLQQCLNSSLKNKLQKLSEAHSENSILPSGLCSRTLKPDDSDDEEFSTVDKANLHTWTTFETVPLADILSCDCRHDRKKRTVISFGLFGVGKTTMVQSCALEWAEGRGYHNIQLLFPLTVWQLSSLKHRLSLIELLQTFYPKLKKLDFSSLNKNNVWFVLDGLEQYELPLDFSCPAVRNISQVSTVANLLINLINGNLLPKAHVWITSTLSVASKIPKCYLLKQTQVQGFSDEQKEQHFRTVIGNDDLANKAIDHVKISRSLFFLCQIPPICSIMANVLKNHLKSKDGFKINPLNLTQIYTNLVQTLNLDSFDKLKELIRMPVGEMNGNTEEMLAVFKQNPLMFKEEDGLHNRKRIVIGHWSLKKYIAASAYLDVTRTQADLSDCCRTLVDNMLRTAKGKHDVFLRFIFGLIKERNMLEPTDPLFEHAKRAMLDNIFSSRSVALFHCLREYDSQAMQSECKLFLKSGSSPIHGLTPVHWEFMIQKIFNFEGIRDQFQMPVSTRCDERLLRQLPAVLKSRKAMLHFSNLTDKCCPALAAVLSTKTSYLRELDLGFNNLSDNGVRELVEGLSDQNCRLKTAKLPACEMTSHACKHLAKFLRLSPKLQELNLCMNEIGDEGLRHLADGLRSPECKLETLKLSQCNIEQKGCSYLASALQKNFGSLKALDLSINEIGDEGASELFNKCDMSQLTKLEIYYCGLTELSCEIIREALKFENSTLVELNLSSNSLGDAGFGLICQGVYAGCTLEKLNVSRCGITALGCTYVAKVLSSVSQLDKGLKQKADWQAVKLLELDLSMNCLQDTGVKEICAGLKNPYGQLKILNLSDCGLTHECCADLASAIASENSAIAELDLSLNYLKDEGVKKLWVGLRSPQSNLKNLSIRTCGLTSKSVHLLIAVLKSHPFNPADLDLSGNRRIQASEGFGILEATTSSVEILHFFTLSGQLSKLRRRKTNTNLN